MPDQRRQTRRAAIILGVLFGIGQAGTVLALGFGPLQVRSGLNQPLDARIDLLSLTPEERKSLSVQIASRDMFERFGIQRSAAVDDLRIQAAGSESGSRRILRLTSRTPVREPFINVLVEAETRSGRAYREYSLLLDPPANTSTRSAASTTRRPTNDSTTRESDRVAAPARRSSASNRGARDGTYGPVASGETLSVIAEQLRPSGASLNQTQVALFRANPEAFDGRMDRLRSGVTLTVPDDRQISAVDAATANRQVSTQRRQRRARLQQDTTGLATAGHTGVMPPRDKRRPPAGTSASAASGSTASPHEQFAPASASNHSPSEDLVMAGAVSLQPGRTRIEPGATVASSGAQSLAVADAGLSAPGPARNDAQDDSDAPPESEPDEPVGAQPNAPTATPAAVDGSAAQQPASNEGDGEVESADSSGAALPEDEVAAVEETGWLLAPRYLLMLLILGLLVLWLLMRRRVREYKSVQLDIDEEDAEARQPRINDVRPEAAQTPPVGARVTPIDQGVRRTPQPVAAGSAATAVAGSATPPRKSTAIRTAPDDSMGLYAGPTQPDTGAHGQPSPEAADETPETDPADVYDWEATEVPAAGEREHDKGDDPGMVFDFDSGDDPDDLAPDTDTISGDQNPPARAPIDPDAFDIGEAGAEPEADEPADDPVSMRLDLARMYLDMEDEQAARPLIEEVLDMGDHTQQQRARNMLASMGDSN